MIYEFFFLGENDRFFDPYQVAFRTRPILHKNENYLIGSGLTSTIPAIRTASRATEAASIRGSTLSVL